MPDISQAVEYAAENPASASVDGRSATSHPIPDLILAEQYVAAKTATTGGRSLWGMTRPARVVPPGTTGPYTTTTT